MSFYFPKREKGQGLVEYALIIALIVLVVLGVLFLLGPQITLAYARIIGAINGMGTYDYSVDTFGVTTASKFAGCEYTIRVGITAKESGVAVPAGTQVGGVASVAGMTVILKTGANGSGQATWNETRTASGEACSSGTAQFIANTTIVKASY